MEPFLGVVLGVVGVVVVGLVIWGLLRYLHARQFRQRGWVFERDPGEAAVFGLNRPPFGRGFGRRVREQVSGQVDGVPFVAVWYTSDTDRRDDFAVVVPLPQSLPGLVVGTPPVLPAGVRGAGVFAPAGLVAYADDAVWGSRALAAMGQPLGALAGRGSAALSVDGSHLIGLGCVRGADALAASVPLVAAAAAALAAPELAASGPPVPPEMSFTDRPDWIYRSRDDAMLDYVRAHRGGYGHEALDVVLGSDPELSFVALRHEWKTDRQVTHRNADGSTSTRTETDHHREDLCEFQLGFPFVDLSLNKSFDWGRGRVRFESDDFNRAFSVRCADGKFASDVFHPRQMEFVQRIRPGAFEIVGDRVYVDHDGRLETVESWWEFLNGFFGRVPEFVWKNLGVRPPALMLRWEG